MFDKFSPSLSIAALLTLISPPASAHSGIPRAVAVHREPGNADHIVVVSDAFGLFHTTDGAETWRLTCAEAYEGDSFGTLHAPVTVLPGGQILAANAFEGLYRSSADACDWTPIDALADYAITDLEPASNGDIYAVAVSTGDAGTPVGSLWRSASGETEWIRQGPLPTASYLSSMGIAPTDPARLYLIAGRSPGGGSTVYRSSDGGGTWQVASELNTGDAIARLRAVSSESADALYLQVDRLPPSLGQEEPADAILYSSDGGRSWATVHQGAGNLPGLALSPDGSRVVIGGPADGIWRARSDDVENLGSEAFTRIYDEPVWALEWTESGLYAGHDDFRSKDAGPRFTLGISQDGGESFEPALVVCDVEPHSCPDTTSAGAVCPDVYSRVGGFEANVLDHARCAGPASPPEQPAPTPPARDDSGGCNCRQTPRRPPAFPWSFLLVAAAGLMRRALQETGGASRRRLPAPQKRSASRPRSFPTSHRSAR